MQDRSNDLLRKPLVTMSSACMGVAELHLSRMIVKPDPENPTSRCRERKGAHQQSSSCPQPGRPGVLSPTDTADRAGAPQPIMTGGAGAAQVLPVLAMTCG